MKRLSVRQVDEKIYRIIGKVNEYTKKGKQFKQQHAIAYCCDLDLSFMTFYGRVRRNQAFGLQYDKKTKCYSVNTDTHPKYYEMQLESAETITLEAIAEKTKRPLTISEIENTEHYKALEADNERLIKEKTQLQESIKRMDVSVRERNGELVRLHFDLKDKNEALIKELKFHKNLNWLKWLAISYGSLSGLYALYHIVMEVLK